MVFSWRLDSNSSLLLFILQQPCRLNLGLGLLHGCSRGRSDDANSPFNGQLRYLCSCTFKYHKLFKSKFKHCLVLTRDSNNLGCCFCGTAFKTETDQPGSRKRLQIRRLLDATVEGMALHDGEFILDANESLSLMFSYSREEILGKSIYTMCSLESGQIAAANIAQQAEASYEAIGIRKDGSRFYIEIRGKKHMLKNGVLGRVAAIQDITERKKNEQTKILFEASQAYSPERMKKFVSQIDRQANRLANLIEDMLDVSRISLGKLSLDIQPTSLNSLIEDTLESLAELIKQNGNEMICKLDPNVIANIDRFRMEQVVINLLTNAIKYGEGKPITINLSKHGNQASISVQDQGMGIAKENQERIFARFERAVTAKNISGLGLGLYIHNKSFRLIMAQL